MFSGQWTTCYFKRYESASARQRKVELDVSQSSICGLSSPVLAPTEPNWTWDYTGITTDQLVGLTDAQLAEFDPLAVNLIVAREIPSLANLELSRYQEQVNAWAREFAGRCLPQWEKCFHECPQDFRDDIRFFRLGMLAQFLDQHIGVTYNEDQRGALRTRYLSGSDLFINGLLDRFQGTCANMAVLHVAMAWRMGWPVSIACIGEHKLVRYDDGQVIHNIEPTETKRGGFSSKSDEQYIAAKQMTKAALSCGSDLRALTPRERLAVFIGLRGRHYRDLLLESGDENFLNLAERDYLLARYLFPAHRVHNRELVFLTACLGGHRFEAHEPGHPNSYDGLLRELHAYENGCHVCQRPMPIRSRRGQSPFEPGGDPIERKLEEE
jgi:hypothetical protein